MKPLNGSPKAVWAVCMESEEEKRNPFQSNSKIGSQMAKSPWWSRAVLLGVQKHFSIVLCRIYRRTSQNRLPCNCFSIDNYYRFRADNWIVSSFSLERGDASLERRAMFWHSLYKSFAMAVFPANIPAKNFYLQKLRRILRVRTQNYLTCNCHFTSSHSLFPKRATAMGASSSRQLKFKRVEAKGLLIVSCSRLKYVKIGTIWATIWGVNMVSEVVTTLASCTLVLVENAYERVHHTLVSAATCWYK
jgi:hypothetical protein